VPESAVNTLRLGFAPGSAVLPSDAADTLKQLAARRGQGVIAVTGYGDAASSDPGAQTAALSLALSRAQAVANALAGDGVPVSAVRVGAEAAGRGASARLIQ
jgi:outer membrane protein OmpA-like peptidoglycan-associated protein